MTRTTIQYLNELNEQRYRKFGSVARIWNNTKILCRKYREEKKRLWFFVSCVWSFETTSLINIKLLFSVYWKLFICCCCLWPIVSPHRISWFLGKFASSGFPWRWDDICCYDAPVYSAKYIFNKTVFSTFFHHVDKHGKSDIEIMHTHNTGRVKNMIKEQANLYKYCVCETA